MPKQYGDPVLSLRITKPMIAAIKIAARESASTPSAYIRDLIAEDLRRRNISIEPTPIAGQIDVDDLKRA